MNQTAILLGVGLLAISARATPECRAETPFRPNVLFIAVDDLNDWVGCLGGHPQAKTPNIDRLAASGVLFANAYCPGASCNPSRSAIMTGIPPHRSGLYNNLQKMRHVLPDAELLPAYFSRNGYWSGGSGKILHYFIDAHSWDDYYPAKEGENPFPPFFDFGDRPIRLPHEPWMYTETDWGAFDVSDDDFRGDVLVTKWVGDQLQRKREKPFFLACGIYRPHEPWFVPRRYFDLFPLDEVQLPPGVKENDLDDVPPSGRQLARNRYLDHIRKHGLWREGVQAYLAAIAYADAMVGRVIDALARSPHRDNTIVVLWSDHGWHLGEKEHWQKFTGWRVCARVPLVVRVPKGTPGLPQGTPAGTRCSRPVNLVDLFKTLGDLCGIPEKERVFGNSLVPLLGDPSADWPHAAVTHLDQPGNYAISTERWRYIHYERGGEELYDVEVDPYEWDNLAGMPQHAARLAEMRSLVPKQIRPKVEPPPDSADVMPNVLFIAVDDLRPELGCYGHKEILSPHIDQLAAESVTFTCAYCQQAVCNPSRASLMTGLRPDSVKVWDLRVHFRDTVPDIVTLPQHFKRHGYYAVAHGKIYHNSLPDRRSWNEPNHWPEKAVTWSNEGLQRLADYREKMRAEGKSEAAVLRMRGPATEDEDVPDNHRSDGEIADQAIESLRKLAARRQPFFLAVGFIRPHLPFVPPKKYWDLYDRDAITLADNPFLPSDSPSMAMNTMYELRDYMDFADSPSPRQGVLTDEQQRRLKHGYYASVSFIDAQIGRLLDTLGELGLRDDTIIVLWGDHGWKLGEHGSWCKQTDYEIDTRVPLIIRASEAQANGQKCHALVEFVDVYPTLCELAGLPRPEHLEGRSMVPLLDAPRQAFKSAAMSQFRRVEEGVEYMGYAMRIDRYRFVEWRERATAEIVAKELYDHQNDPEENTNIAGSPENRDLVEQLTKALHKANPPKPMPIRPGLRSQPSGVPAKLVLVNRLAEPVTVYWLDSYGARKQPKVIQPGSDLVENTFLMHPFVVESESGEYYRIVFPDYPDRRVILAAPNEAASADRGP